MRPLGVICHGTRTPSVSCLTPLTDRLNEWTGSGHQETTVTRLSTMTTTDWHLYWQCPGCQRWPHWWHSLTSPHWQLYSHRTCSALKNSDRATRTHSDYTSMTWRHWGRWTLTHCPRLPPRGGTRRVTLSAISAKLSWWITKGQLISVDTKKRIHPDGVK